MADALLNTSDPQQPNERGYSTFDEDSDDDDSTNDSNYYYQDTHLSDQLEKRRATCRYFDNHPRTIHNGQVLNNDYFYQEHLKACHFSPCKPLPAPHDDILPEEPPLRAEVPFSLMTTRLTPVKLRDKLFSSRHIRLVRFLPGQSDNTKHGHLRLQSISLQCIVYQVSLDDIWSDGQPMFAALSYVCGNPALTQHVRCGEDYVPTTQNLFEALTYVRHEDCPRLSWVDGLCINQEDIEERSHQVGLLHQIYRRAHVVIWLGAGDQTDLTALSTYLSSTARAWTSIVRSTEAANFNPDEVRAAAIVEYEKRRDKQVPFPDIDRIVDARYFTRVWVAQEIFLGKSATCQLGNRLFSAASLIASMELWEHHYHIDQDTLDDMLYFYLMPSLAGTWRSLQSGFQMQDLTIVRSFGRKQCSDPRDHIYGLSALFENPTAYPVDYSRSVAEVFCDFTVHCLETLGSLSVFSNFRSIMKPSQMVLIANVFKRTTKNFIDDGFELPSWCPSWPSAEFQVARGLYSDFRDRWDASGGHSIVLDRPSSLVITLRGCVVSNVAWRSTETVATVRHHQSAGMLIKEAAEHLLGLPDHVPLSNSGRKPNLARLLLSVLETLVEEQHDYYGLCHSLRGSRHELTPSTWRLLSRSEPGYALRELIGPVYLAREFNGLCPMAEWGIDCRIPADDHEYIANLTSDRILGDSEGCCLFVTAGGMLGSGLPGIMAGDVVCIIFGSNVPHILRPTQVEGQYLLVGECYVKELMEGQAMDMGLQEQTFTLV